MSLPNALPNSYFVECSAKNSTNVSANNKFTCDFQSFEVREGSQITLSSAYINSVGAGDLISMNSSGDNQDNKARIVFNFYGSNSALNQQREGYNFNTKPTEFFDYDNKECILYRYEELGERITPPTDLPADYNNIFVFQEAYRPIEDPYLNGRFFGEFDVAQLNSSHYDTVATGPNKNIAVMDVQVGKFELDTYELDFAVKFTNFHNENAEKFLKRAFYGCYFHMFLKIPASNGDPARWLCGVSQVMDIFNNETDPPHIIGIVSESNSFNFQDMQGNEAGESWATQDVEIFLGFPSKADIHGALYSIPPNILTREDESSAYLPAGTKVYNYALDTHQYGSVINGFKKIDTTKQEITVMEKLWDTEKLDDFSRTGSIETATYQVGMDNDLDVVMGSADSYDRCKDVFMSDEINIFVIVKIEAPNVAVPTFSLYKWDSIIDASTYKFRLTPIQERLGDKDSENINISQQYTYNKAGSKVTITSQRQFLKDAYLGMTVSSNGYFGISNDDIWADDNTFKTVSILSHHSYRPSADAKLIDEDSIDKAIVVSHTSRVSRDFVVHYRYKDLSVENLSYVSPSDLATSITEQMHELTNPRNDRGVEIPNSYGKGIPQNEFIFPIWFPYNAILTLTDGKFTSTDYNVANPTLADEIYEFEEPTSSTYRWIHNNGNETYGAMGDYMRRTFTPKNITAGYEYKIHNCLLPIGFFVYIHYTEGIPNVSNHNYFIYPRTKHTYYNRGDMTDGPNGSAGKSFVWADGVNIDESTLTSYADIEATQEIIGFPIEYVADQNCWASSLCGTTNPTIVYDDTISKFSVQLFSQPYTTAWNESTATGGDNATIIYFPSLTYKKNLTRMGGINVVNWFAEFYDRGLNNFGKTDGYISPLDVSTPNAITERFWRKFGYNTSFLQENQGFSYGTPSLYKDLTLKGTTDSKIDSSFAIITQADNGINAPRYIDANFYRATSAGTKDATAEQAKYEFSSLTGQDITNASLAYDLPNTEGTGDIYNTQTFTADVTLKNKNGHDVSIHAKGDNNALDTFFNPDRQRQRQYTVKVTSSKILAPSLPVKVEEPFFYVLSSFIDDGSYITSTLSKTAICGVVSKLNASLDYFYSYVSPVSFVCRKTKIVSSITIEIVNSELQAPPLINANSVVIFQVTEPPPIPTPIPLTIPQKQLQLFELQEQLIKKEPKTGEALVNLVQAKLFPKPAQYPTYEEYLSKIPQDEIPMTKRKYAQSIRRRKKADDLLELAKKTKKIADILGMQPQDVGLGIFNSLISNNSQNNNL